jgi:hypothetical protein
VDSVLARLVRYRPAAAIGAARRWLDGPDIQDDVQFVYAEPDRWRVRRADGSLHLLLEACEPARLGLVVDVAKVGHLTLLEAMTQGGQRAVRAELDADVVAVPAPDVFDPAGEWQPSPPWDGID